MKKRKRNKDRRSWKERNSSGIFEKIGGSGDGDGNIQEALETASEAAENSSHLREQSSKAAEVPGKESEEKASIPGEESAKAASAIGKKPAEKAALPGGQSSKAAEVPGKESEEKNSLPGGQSSEAAGTFTEAPPSGASDEISSDGKEVSGAESAAEVSEGVSPEGAGASEGVSPEGTGASEGVSPEGAGASEGVSPEGAEASEGVSPEGAEASEGVSPEGTDASGAGSQKEAGAPEGQNKEEDEALKKQQKEEARALRKQKREEAWALRKQKWAEAFARKKEGKTGGGGISHQRKAGDWMRLFMPFAGGILALVAALVLVLTVNAGKPAPKSFSVLAEAVEQVSGVSEIPRGTLNQLQRYYRLDKNGIRGFRLHRQTGTRDFAEVLVIEADSSARAEMYAGAARQRLREITAMSDGSEAASRKLEEAVLVTNGRYLLFAVCENAYDCETAFLSALRGA